MESRTDRFTALEDQYASYEVYDPNGEKIGKVDDLFVDKNDQPEYIGVKMGFLGTRSTLLPWELATVDEQGHRIEVSQPKSTVKDGPSFDDDREITPEYENEVRSYYGLGAVDSIEERGTYGDYDGEHSGAVTTSKHEEVSVERVPVEGEATEAQIGEDEVSVPVTEEEVVTEKRAVAKEEIRIRKDVVEDTEVVEDDVRREEIDVEDATERGSGTGR